ncbi:putative thiol-disulfide isomerase [Actinacidiphila reveromycinica]|uniref:Putative thiol-disulfide isomerase n=1 Tax=Actinacidiphila reveromycinica TaxID=659352 RepID=A0A7U3VPX7_9ACTN|nr:thioredoxin family protein [Streptomyces sp. SN-593]BBA99079.1 putative thiol-disulfide isomerase [Streptomyces sp. SN-593]
MALLLAACGGSGGSGGSSDASAPAGRTTGTAATAPGSPSAGGAPTAITRTTTAATPPSATTSPEGYDPTRNAAADVTAAERASAKDGRPVLIDFGADWCPDCVVLGRTFTKPATAALLGRYHVVRVDVGQFDHNLALVARYVDLDSSGIPALAVVDRHGTTVTATNQGQFSNARSMPESQVDAFLKTWA